MVLAHKSEGRSHHGKLHICSLSMSRKIALLCVCVCDQVQQCSWLQVYICVRSDSQSSQSTLINVTQYFLQINKTFNFFKKLMSPVSFSALFLSYGAAFPIEPLLVVFFFSYTDPINPLSALRHADIRCLSCWRVYFQRQSNFEWHF